MKMDPSDPRQQACLALHLAGFPVEQVADDFFDQAPSDGFDLSFDAGQECVFTLGWDSGADQWLVSGQLKGRAQDVAVAALELNHILPPGFRLQSDPVTGTLAIATRLGREGLPLDELAMAIMDLNLWLHRIADAQLQTASQQDVQAPFAGKDLDKMPLHDWAIRG